LKEDKNLNEALLTGDEEGNVLPADITEKTGSQSIQ
jgi:hypothetical protein